MNTLTIVRGCSGCGKSTYIKEVIKNNVSVDMSYSFKIVSADAFFMKTDDDDNSFYDFDPSLLSVAHSWCLSEFISAIRNNTPNIFVDNTNIHHWEYQNYLKIAKMHGYIIYIVELMPVTINDLRVCIERNQHKVPAAVVSRMCIDFEPDKNASVRSFK